MKTQENISSGKWQCGEMKKKYWSKLRALMNSFSFLKSRFKFQIYKY